MTSHIITIPQQLQSKNFRFIRIDENNKKKPKDSLWTSVGHYAYNSGPMVEWIAAGHNYGVVTGYGNLIVIDCDDPELQTYIDSGLPETFQVKTSKGYHNYYICTPIEGQPKIIFEKNKQHLGELQSVGQMVVGPSCVHPSGAIYEITKNIDITEITPADIEKAFPDDVMKNKQPKKEQTSESEETKPTPRYNKRLIDVVPLDQLKRQHSGEYQGPHPIHSKDTPTERDFTLNPEKDVWHCFWHNCGGGIIEWIAITEGIIDCDPDFENNLTNDVYKQAFEIAKSKYGISVDHTSLDNVLSRFDEEDRIREYLDIGIANNKLYYGKLTHNKPTIILDDKTVLWDERQQTLDENGRKTWAGEDKIRTFIDYTGYIGDIMPRWSNNSIKEYLTGKRVSKIDVFDKVHSNINEFMDFSYDENMEGALEVQTCWVIATYMYPIFNWFPHLLFWGPRGSGKTKNAQLLMYQSFGGFLLGSCGDVPPAVLYNVLEGNRGTLFLDEFERIESKESQIILNQLLNAACSRDAYIIKNVQVGKKWRPQKFPIFSPKIAANISGINETSLTRYIPFQLIKTKTVKGRKKPVKEKQRLEEVRHDLHIFALQHWKEIKHIYDNLVVDDLINRDEDNWLPILSVATFFGNHVVEKIHTYMKNAKEIAVETGSIDGEFLEILYDMVEEKEQYYTPTTIAAWCSDLLFSIAKDHAKWVGKKLSRYGFKKERRGHGGINVYRLSRAKIKDKLDRYYPLILQENEKHKKIQQGEGQQTLKDSEEKQPREESCNEITPFNTNISNNSNNSNNTIDGVNGVKGDVGVISCVPTCKEKPPMFVNFCVDSPKKPNLKEKRTKEAEDIEKCLKEDKWTTQ